MQYPLIHVWFLLVETGFCDIFGGFLWPTIVTDTLILAFIICDTNNTSLKRSLFHGCTYCDLRDAGLLQQVFYNYISIMQHLESHRQHLDDAVNLPLKTRLVNVQALNLLPEELWHSKHFGSGIFSSHTLLHLCIGPQFFSI